MLKKKNIHFFFLLPLLSLNHENKDYRRSFLPDQPNKTRKKLKKSKTGTTVVQMVSSYSQLPFIHLASYITIHSVNHSYTHSFIRLTLCIVNCYSSCSIGLWTIVSAGEHRLRYLTKMSRLPAGYLSRCSQNRYSCSQTNTTILQFQCSKQPTNLTV